MVQKVALINYRGGGKGTAGPGVAAGGDTGQILAKASGADFDTGWVDPEDVDGEIAALKGQIIGFVNHGSTADTPRPTGFGTVQWMGDVEPENAIAGDTWLDTSE